MEGIKIQVIILVSWQPSSLVPNQTAKCDGDNSTKDTTKLWAPDTDVTHIDRTNNTLSSTQRRKTLHESRNPIQSREEWEGALPELIWDHILKKVITNIVRRIYNVSLMESGMWDSFSTEHS